MTRTTLRYLLGLLALVIAVLGIGQIGARGLNAVYSTPTPCWGLCIVPTEQPMWFPVVIKD